MHNICLSSRQYRAMVLFGRFVRISDDQIFRHRRTHGGVIASAVSAGARGPKLAAGALTALIRA